RRARPGERAVRHHAASLSVYLTAIRKRASKLGETAAPEGRLEELIDALHELRRPRIGARAEGRLDLVEGLELAEELYVAEAAAAGEHLAHAIDLRGERLDADPRRTDATRVRMIA